MTKSSITLLFLHIFIISKEQEYNDNEDNNMKLKVFTKTDCPKCPIAKELGQKIEKEGKTVEWFDLDQEEGLTEAVYFDVLSTPSLIVTDEDDEVIKAWRGEVPQYKEVQNELQK